jgi:hypothetical protein
MDAVYAALVTTKKAAGIRPVKILQIAAGCTHVKLFKFS